MAKENPETVKKKVNEYLSAYVSEAEPYLHEFFNNQQAFSSQISPIAQEMVEKYHNFIGGKRLRGALTTESYRMFGGEENYEILKTSVIVEIIHGFGLIHDDIMDQDDLRRGNPTIHRQYREKVLKEKGISKEQADLYGISMGIMVGDLGPLFGNLIVGETNFPPERKVRLLSKVSETILYTIYGQGLDVTFEQNEIPTEDEAMQVHRYKTAYYTITGPLQYGAILAGVEEKDKRYQALAKYGLPIGIAFQLKDDELGMFSETEKIGKPVFSDLRQGKVTVLFAKTFENADNSQLKFLKSVYGKLDASQEDLEKVREIVIETGALEYSRNLCLQLISEGTSHINDITSDEKYRDLLNLIAEFVSSREN